LALRVDGLTDLGRGLSKPVEALGQWAFDYRIEIESARTKFDRRNDDR
jgi:DNA-binding HxlR family transcriptional regulator